MKMMMMMMMMMIKKKRREREYSTVSPLMIIVVNIDGACTQSMNRVATTSAVDSRLPTFRVRVLVHLTKRDDDEGEEGRRGLHDWSNKRAHICVQC